MYTKAVDYWYRAMSEGIEAVHFQSLENDAQKYLFQQNGNFFFHHTQQNFKYVAVAVTWSGAYRKFYKRKVIKQHCGFKDWFICVEI